MNMVLALRQAFIIHGVDCEHLVDGVAVGRAGSGASSQQSHTSWDWNISASF